MFPEVPLLLGGVPELLGQPPVLLSQVVHSLRCIVEIIIVFRSILNFLSLAQIQGSDNLFNTGIQDLVPAKYFGTPPRFRTSSERNLRGPEIVGVPGFSVYPGPGGIS